MADLSSAISVQGLRQTYGHAVALDGLDLEIGTRSEETSGRLELLLATV